MWRLWLIIPIAVFTLAATPPMPPGPITVLRSPKDAQTFVRRTPRAVIPKLKTVTLAFDVETVATNYPPIYLGLSANADLTSTNWQVIWTNAYPRSMSTYAATNIPGSWWTSNYTVTITVTLTNQPATVDNYRAFYHDDF